jgi:hypothetical protein
MRMLRTSKYLYLLPAGSSSLFGFCRCEEEEEEASLWRAPVIVVVVFAVPSALSLGLLDEIGFSDHKRNTL